MTATETVAPSTTAPGAWGPPVRTAPLDPTAGHEAEVVIVGGGLTGLSAAYHLLRARPGLDLLLVERDGLGAGATGRSTGMLTPGVGQDLPGQLRRLGPARARRMYEATLAAVRDAAALIAREAIECDLRLGGQLVLARGPGGRRRLQALGDALRRLELPCEPLDDEARAAALRVAWAPSPGPGPAALRLPVAGTLDPVALARGLAARVQALGGRVHTGTPVRLDGERLRLARGGAVRAERVVAAAGGLAPALGLQRGRVLPLVLRALATEPLSPEARAALGWAGGEGVIDSRRLFDYVRLTADDRVVFGAGRPAYRWGGRPGPDALGPRARAALETELGRLFPPGLAPAVRSAWSGQIDYTLDGLPVVGFDRRRPRVLHAGGWCGHGIALSLASGAWVAALLSGEAPADQPWLRAAAPWVPLEPARFLGVKVVLSAMAWQDRRGC